MSFCKSLTDVERKNQRLTEGYEYTLPTEVQWKYACRSRSKTRYSLGSRLSLELANVLFAKTNIEETKLRRVGSYAANSWGLHDMHGNIFEWCYDWYSSDNTEDLVDPMGPEDGNYRIARVGAFEAYDYQARSANRSKGNPEKRSLSTGFRVCLAPIRR